MSYIAALANQRVLQVRLLRQQVERFSPSDRNEITDSTESSNEHCSPLQDVDSAANIQDVRPDGVHFDASFSTSDQPGHELSIGLVCTNRLMRVNPATYLGSRRQCTQPDTGSHSVDGDEAGTAGSARSGFLRERTIVLERDPASGQPYRSNLLTRCWKSLSLTARPKQLSAPAIENDGIPSVQIR